MFSPQAQRGPEEALYQPEHQHLSPEYRETSAIILSIIEQK